MYDNLVLVLNVLDKQMSISKEYIESLDPLVYKTYCLKKAEKGAQ